MEPRRLKYFVRIVELGSMSQAAADLYVAQPALSKSMLALEESLGTALLHRSPQGVAPTDAGRRLYEHAQVILRQLERATIDVKDAGGTTAGQVAVGMSYSIASAMLVPFLRAAKDALPHVKLQIFQEPRHSLPDKILSGRIDVGVMVYPNARAGIRHTPVLREKLMFVCNPRLAARYPRDVTLADISETPLILPTRDNGLRIFLESLFLTHSLPLRIVHEIDAMAQFVECVESGLGSTILPAGCLGSALAHRRAKSRAIADPSLARSVAVAHAQARPLTGAASRVEALLRDVIRQLVQRGEWLGATLIGV